MSYDRNSKWNNRNKGRSFHGRGRVGNVGGWQGRGSNRGHFDRNRQSNQTNNVWERNNRPRPELPTNRLSEVDIGVTEYIGEHPGFSGIIKWRYSDFQVSEINLQGEVAKLTDLSVPVPPADKIIEEDEELLLNKYDVEILPLETWDRINKISVCTEETNETVEIDVTEISKEQRTKIHNAVKKAFGKSIVGSTVNVDNKKTIKLEKFRKGVRIDNRVKWVWPKEYLYFILHKENCDTMEATMKIAEILRTRPSVLTYAGTKDRRAVTSQWVSARRVEPKRVAAAAGAWRGLRVGNFEFRATPLALGALKGNRFRIAVRRVTAPAPQVEAACESLRARGFLNYYGLQRFGARREVPTHCVGRALLKADFKGAVDLLLKAGATGSSTEKALRRALSARPSDFVGALDKVPRNVRLLYTHAYQSLVWNRAVSERLRRFGREPVAGDLVMEEACEEPVIDDCYDAEDADEEKSDSEDAKEQPEEAKKASAKVLSERDVQSGAYTIYDVVMPLPGFAIQYPDHMKDYYQQLLEEDGLTLELKNRVKKYSMSGAYRAMCVLPTSLEWSLRSYQSPYSDLIASDLQELALDGQESTQEPEGEYKALLLTFDLPSSCYATMVLRELLKLDTSVEFQASLSHGCVSTADQQPQEQSHEQSQEQSQKQLQEQSQEQSQEQPGSQETQDKQEGGDKRKLESAEQVDVKKLKTD